MGKTMPDRASKAGVPEGQRWLWNYIDFTNRRVEAGNTKLRIHSQDNEKIRAHYASFGLPAPYLGRSGGAAPPPQVKSMNSSLKRRQSTLLTQKTSNSSILGRSS
jgi:hypothetical protein